MQAFLHGLDPEEFQKWYVAYHVLHLDGSPNAGLVAATIRNGLAPIVAGWFGGDFEIREAADYAPPTLFGDEDEARDQAGPDQASIDEFEAFAAANYGQTRQTTDKHNDGDR